nr:MAG TPA: hypothetical protein [Caudoviricetes sp.]
MEKDIKEVKMHKYIGTKVVKAYPCPAWKNAGGHKVGDEGYKVIYEDGYVSWSPKDVFEKHYKKSDTYIDRMKIEYEELQDRRMKLIDFLEYHRDLINDNEYYQMTDQLAVMSEYASVLRQRIDYAKLKAEMIMEKKNEE